MDDTARRTAVAVAVVAVLLLLMGAAVTGAFWMPFPALLGFGLPIVLNFALIVGGIVHVLVRPDLTGIQRLIWLAIVIFVTPIVAIGAIVYFVLGRARTAELFRDLGPPPQVAPPPRP